MREVVEYAVSEMDPQKIFLGIPNYGYDFTVPFNPNAPAARTISNEEAIRLAIDVGAEIKFDEKSQTPYFNYTRDAQRHEVHFEDARSIIAKLSLANEFGLFGIGVWNIMNFFPQLWVVFNLLYNQKRI